MTCRAFGVLLPLLLLLLLLLQLLLLLLLLLAPWCNESGCWNLVTSRRPIKWTRCEQ